MALAAGGTPGRSEMSHGKGMMAHPQSDFQSNRVLPFQEGEDRHDLVNRYRAELRLDPTNSAEVLEPDMYTVEGNPDMFGPEPAMIQEDVHRPAGAIPLPIYRTGVYREE